MLEGEIRQRAKRGQGKFVTDRERKVAREGPRKGEKGGRARNEHVRKGTRDELAEFSTEGRKSHGLVAGERF
eukprot:4346496-Pleurochrysis_carterae.AAC.1